MTTNHLHSALALSALLLLSACAGNPADNTPTDTDPSRITRQEDLPPPVRIEKVTLGSGLEIEDLVPGTGDLCLPDSRIRVRYTCRLLDGRIVDESGPQAVTHALPRMIRGWQDGLPGMRVGGKRKLTVPANLGYGSRSVKDSQGIEVIPPESTLIYEVDLLGLEVR